MHSQKETLAILGCNKSTISRYVKSGDLERVKKGRQTYYHEHEVAVILNKIDKNKAKQGKEVKVKRIIPIKDDIPKEVLSTELFHELTTIGMSLLLSATTDLKELGLYKECDKQILLMYAFSGQMTTHFANAMLAHDGIATTDAGVQSVHPYHKMMQYHETQMLKYMDRLGLNPLSRNKFEIKW